MQRGPGAQLTPRFPIQVTGRGDSSLTSWDPQSEGHRVAFSSMHSSRAALGSRIGDETGGGTHGDEIEVMATIVDMALDSSPSDSHLLDILSWGSRVRDRKDLRPIAQTAQIA